MTTASRIASVLILLVIALVTLGPIDLRPTTGHSGLERAAAYLLFGIALGIGFPRRIKYSLAFIVGFAAVLEALQFIDPGRHARIEDMLVKAAAGIVGILLSILLMKMWGHADAG